MKKEILIGVMTVMLSLSSFKTVDANMAAPQESDVGSSIAFEQQNSISVLSEVIDITVQGSYAKIVATYQMKNTTNDVVSTPSMFISPNIEAGDVTITSEDEDIPFSSKSYALNYDTEIITEDWRYTVLTDEKQSSETDPTVDTISFVMNFEPKQEQEIKVSYTYRLGGYPDYDFNAKNGMINYYLTPAHMWKDFSNLTINLHLDEDMPVIKHSNLVFEKVGSHTYQYVSDELPSENLELVIDENWIQNIFSTLRNPYLGMYARIFAPFILVAGGVVGIFIWLKHKIHRISSNVKK